MLRSMAKRSVYFWPHLPNFSGLRRSLKLMTPARPSEGLFSVL